MTLQEFIQLCLQAEAYQEQRFIRACDDCLVKPQCLGFIDPPDIPWCELPEALREFGVEL